MSLLPNKNPIFKLLKNNLRFGLMNLTKSYDSLTSLAFNFVLFVSAIESLLNSTVYTYLSSNITYFLLGFKYIIVFFILLLLFLKKGINLKILLIQGLFFALYSISVINTPDTAPFIIRSLKKFVITSMNAYLLLAIKDKKIFFHHLTKFSILYFFILLIFLCGQSLLGRLSAFTKSEDGYYMLFAYSMLPFLNCMLYSIFQNHKYFNAIIYLFGLTVLVIFGCRGAVICTFSFFIILLFRKYYVEKKMCRFFISLIILSIMIFVGLLGMMNFKVMLDKKLGVNSYVINSFFRSTGFYSDRDRIWKRCWNATITDIGFKGLHADSCLLYPIPYVHNIVLEILYNFGILWGYIFLFLLFLLAIRPIFYKKNNAYNDFLLFLFSLCGMKLMVTNSFILEVWFGYWLFSSLGPISLFKKKA